MDCTNELIAMLTPLFVTTTTHQNVIILVAASLPRHHKVEPYNPTFGVNVFFDASIFFLVSYLQQFS